MTKYDSVHHNPPAPLAWAVIKHPDTGAKVSNVPMLIDSGADVTLLPAATIEQLGLLLDTGKGYELEGFDEGSRRIAHPAMAIVEINDLRFKGSYLFADRAIGLLGRNILNHVILELNGPNLVWSIRKS